MELAKLYDDEIKEALVELKKQWNKNKKNRGRKFKSPSIQKILSMPRSTRGNSPMFPMNPRFASRNPATLLAAISRSRCFELDLEVAREMYIEGKRKVVFPLGTYGFRELYGVVVKKGRQAA